MLCGFKISKQVVEIMEMGNNEHGSNELKELTFEEVHKISGGFHVHFNIGAAVGAIVLDAITGGPVGIGYAVSALIISEGVNNLNELSNQ